VNKKTGKANNEQSTKKINKQKRNKNKKESQMMILSQSKLSTRKRKKKSLSEAPVVIDPSEEAEEVAEAVEEAIEAPEDLDLKERKVEKEKLAAIKVDIKVTIKVDTEEEGPDVIMAKARNKKTKSTKESL